MLVRRNYALITRVVNIADKDRRRNIVARRRAMRRAGTVANTRAMPGALRQGSSPYCDTVSRCKACLRGAARIFVRVVFQPPHVSTSEFYSPPAARSPPPSFSFPGEFRASDGYLIARAIQTEFEDANGSNGCARP